MNIDLYYNSSEKNKIGKSLSNKVSLSGSLRDESNVVTPSILISSNNPINSNYCFIHEFKRYYFVKEITSVRTGLWRLSLEVDVLESFKDYYMNLNCNIEKTEELIKSNKNFNDGSFSLSEKTFNEIITFPHQVGNTPVYLLTCI